MFAAGLSTLLLAGCGGTATQQRSGSLDQMRACAPPAGDLSLNGYRVQDLASADAASARSQAPAAQTVGVFQGSRQVAVITAFPVAKGDDANFLAGVRSGAVKQRGSSALESLDGSSTVRVDLPAQTMYAVRRGCRYLLVGAAKADAARGFAAQLAG